MILTHHNAINSLHTGAKEFSPDVEECYISTFAGNMTTM